MTDTLTLPGQLNFTIFSGATFHLPITWKTAAKAVVPLVGCAAWLQIRKPMNAPTAIVELSTTNGGIVLANTIPNIMISLSDEQTALLPPWGSAPYALLIEFATGDRKRLLEGVVTLSLSAVRGVPQ
jgi:hypothetical protein